MPDDLIKPTDQPVAQVPEPPKEEPKVSPVPPPPEPSPGLPPEEPSKPIETPTEPIPPSQPPPEEPPLVVSTPPPKKSRVKVILASIVGLILLASIPAGVYLVQQRQEIREEAGTGSECFEPPRLYKPAPYEYHLGDTHSPGSGDWVVYRIKEPCANPQRLTEIFGPLDRLFNKEVYITRPNQPYQYGFTFNRIMHIDGYNDAQIQSGYPDLTEQQLHDLHMAGKDSQSIRHCDKNGRQVVFDLTGEDEYGKVAKPNGWEAWETGYYQFDLTPKFRCEGGALHQGSLGAGFIRVVEAGVPTPTPTPTPTSTPTPTPTQVLSCADLTSTPGPSGLSSKDKITLTCKGTSKPKSMNHFEFRVSKDGGTPTNLPSAPATKTDSEYKGEITYTIPDYGCYKIECRACVSADSLDCTVWGQAGKSLTK